MFATISEQFFRWGRSLQCGVMFAHFRLLCVQPTGGNYIYTAGTYKPRIRCYEVDQLSMKFERQLQAEVVAMQCLSEDYSKLAMLLADRSVEVHVRL